MTASPSVVESRLDTRYAAETPEGIALWLRPAGIVPRLYAYLVDIAIRFVFYSISFLFLALLGTFGEGLALVLFFLLEWLYPVAFELSSGAATPGKRLMGIMVLNDDGTPVRWPAAITRNLLRAADFLPFLYGVGLISMLINRDFKRLGDLAAGTVVVYQGEKAEAARAIPQAAPQPPPLSLSPEEQRAVLELAERSSTFTRERFEELAELPTPLVGRAVREAATNRILGIANYLAGRQ